MITWAAITLCLYMPLQAGTLAVPLVAELVGLWMGIEVQWSLAPVCCACAFPRLLEIKFWSSLVDDSNQTLVALLKFVNFLRLCQTG